MVHGEFLHQSERYILSRHQQESDTNIVIALVIVELIMPHQHSHYQLH